MALNVSGKLILAFFTLILGVVLIGSIASNSLAVTDKQWVTDESVDISTARIYGAENNINVSVTFALANPPTSWKRLDCPIEDFVLSNSSTDFTVTTDYTLNTGTGVITLVNSTNFLNSPENTSLIDYRYCGDDYMNSSWGRTVLLLLAGFFALAILGASVGLFYSVAKDTGLI
jgi:hypothetical protein